MIVAHELLLFEQNELGSLIIDFSLLAEAKFELLVLEYLDLLVPGLSVDLFFKDVGL